MAFPVDELDLTIEFVSATDFYDDVYTDLYGAGVVVPIDRLLNQQVTITHGRTDPDRDVDAGTLRFTVLNQDGLFTPDDPRSPYYPQFGLGIGCRVLINGVPEFHGEVSSIEPLWTEGDLSQNIADPYDLPAEEDDNLGYATVAITASGIFRRLGQGIGEARSPLTRVIALNVPRVVEFWPCEDEQGSVGLASGLPVDQIAFPADLPRIETAGFTLATDATLAGASALPHVDKDGIAQWAARMSARCTALDNGWVFEFDQLMPEGPDNIGQSIVFDLDTTGSICRWSIQTGWDGTNPFVRFRGYQPGNPVAVVERLKTNPVAMFGPSWFTTRIAVTQVGPDITWSWSWSPISTGVDPLRGFSGTYPSVTCGHPTFARSRAAGAVNGGYSFGMVTVHDGIAAGWLVGPDVGWQGEHAAVRIQRLCNEDRIPMTLLMRPGDTAAKSVALGIQTSVPVLELLREAALADGGTLREAVSSPSLVYMTRRWHYNRPADWVLDASQSEISDPFVPTVDDQNLINDVTAERIGGSKQRRTDPVSAADPPAGEGRRDTTVSLSLENDRQCANQASWRLHRGSWYSRFNDQPSGSKARYSQLSIDLAASAEANPALIDEWMAIRMGYRVQVTNLPPQHTIEVPVDVIVEGWSQTISPLTWLVTLNCSPAGPWQVARWLVDRWSPKNRTLATAIDDTQTTITVANNGGVDWTTTAVPFDIRVDRVEVMTVTAVAAPVAGSQDFTVVRNVNQFARAHPAGALVRVAPPAILGL